MYVVDGCLTEFLFLKDTQCSLHSQQHCKYLAKMYHAFLLTIFLAFLPKVSTIGPSGPKCIPFVTVQ